MSALESLQRQFHNAIVGGDESAILNHIKGGFLKPAERLRIYRNNAYEGFRQTLASAFPVIERLVGQGCFRGLALDYFHSYPSDSGDLGTYGQFFARLLRRRYADSTFDYLHDVALLEWAYQEVMMAADAGVLRARDIADVAPNDYEHLCLHLHPAVRLVRSKYPILSIWQSNRQGEHPVTLNIHGAAECVVLHRTPRSVELQKLDAAELVLLDACAGGCSITVASERALSIDPSLDLQNALNRAFAIGVFSDYSLRHARA